MIEKVEIFIKTEDQTKKQQDSSENDEQNDKSKIIDGKRFACKHCGKKCKTKKTLWEHTKVFHVNEHEFQCFTCDKPFMNEKFADCLMKIVNFESMVDLVATLLDFVASRGRSRGGGRRPEKIGVAD